MQINCMNSNYVYCYHSPRRNGLTMFSTLFPRVRQLTQAETGSGRLRSFALTLAMMVGSLILSRAAHASEAVSLPPFTSAESKIIWAVLASGIVSVIVGAVWFSAVN